MKYRLSDLVGAALVEGSPVRVTAKNAAVYAANVMARDAGASTLGDDDPAFLLQPGATLTAAGPPVTNAHGVAYAPVTVPGRDGPFFIRVSSIGLVTSTMAPVAAVAAAPAQPWWVWLLIAIGGVGVAAGSYKLMKDKRRR